jgi:hypothetical protein
VATEDDAPNRDFDEGETTRLSEHGPVPEAETDAGTTREVDIETWVEEGRRRGLDETLDALRVELARAGVTGEEAEHILTRVRERATASA